MEFWQDMHMFDDDYIGFLLQLLQTSDEDMRMETLQHLSALWSKYLSGFRTFFHAH